MKQRISSMFIISFLACLLMLSISSPLFAASNSKTEIQIYSNPFGNATYVMSFALAEIINKYSDKLHATCLESKSSSANMLYLQQNPDARKNTIILSSPSSRLSKK